MHIRFFLINPVLERVAYICAKQMKICLLFGMSFLFWPSVLSTGLPVRAMMSPTIPDGLIITDTRWTLANSPYLLVEDLTVVDGVTLTIEAGVVVMIERDVTLYVEGNLRAVGTSTAPVEFRSTATTGTGHWGSLRIGGGSNLGDSDATWLSYVIIDGAGGRQAASQPSLMLDRSTPRLDHLTIRSGAGAGLHLLSTGAVVLDTATISSNAGHGVLVQGGNGQALHNITIQGNGGYGIYAFGTNSLTLRNSTVASNGVAARLPANTELLNIQWVANTRNEIEIESGAITNNLTWNQEEASYRLLGDITVADGVTLTIEAGVQALIERGQSLSVDGTLLAVGTITAPITFIGVEQSIGYWGSLRIGGGNILTDSDGSQLSYVILDGGGKPSVSPQPSLVLNQSAPQLDHLTIRHSGGPGLHAFLTGPFILNTATIADNAGHGIILQGGNGQSLNNLTIQGNAGDGINVSTNGDLTINTAHIANNSGAAIAQSEIDIPAVYRELTFARNGVDAVTIPPGIVNRRIFLSAPRYLLGETTIERIGSLTVAPATTLMFQPDAALHIFGEFRAQGRIQAPVTFTSASAQPAPGRWQGLDVQSGAQVYLANCLVEYALTGLMVQTSLDIDVCTIRHNRTGIMVVDSAKVMVRASQIYSNTEWGIRNETPASPVRALLNWWGATTGPQHSTNLAGGGDPVSDGVLFRPWLIAPSGADLARTAESVIPGVILQRAVKQGQYADYFVEIGSPQGVIIEVRPTKPVMASLLVLERFAAPPFPLPGEVDTWSDQAHDGIFRLIVPMSTPGRIYFTVIGQGSVDQVLYDLHVFTATYHLATVSPASAPPTETYLHARGYFPLNEREVKLCTTNNPQVVTGRLDTLSNTEGRLFFNLSGVAEGTYDLCVQWPDGAQQRLSGAVQVRPGRGQLTARIETPPLVRQSRRYTAWLYYANTGTAPLPAPLFVINVTGALLSASPSDAYGEELHLFGYSDTTPVGSLLPGSERRIPIYFEVTRPQVTFQLGIVDVAVQGAFPWAQIEPVFRPEPAPANWSQRWAVATQSVGVTWSEVVNYLQSYVNYMTTAPTPPSLDMLLAYWLSVELSVIDVNSTYQESMVDSEGQMPPALVSPQLFTCPLLGPLATFVFDPNETILVDFDAAAYLSGKDLIIQTAGNNDTADNPIYTTTTAAILAKPQIRNVTLARINWDAGAKIGGILPWAKTLCRNQKGQNILQAVGEAAAQNFRKQLNGMPVDCQRITLIGHSFGNAIHYYFAKALCPGFFKPRAFLLDPASLVAIHGITDYASAFSSQESLAIYTDSPFDEQVWLGNITGHRLMGAPNGLKDPLGAHSAGRPQLVEMIKKCCDPTYPVSCEKFLATALGANNPYIKIMGQWVFVDIQSFRVPVVTAVDPNQKVAWNRIVQPGETVRFTIQFENVMTATAPAQDVLIIDSLDPRFDWTSVQFVEAGFGRQQISLSASPLQQTFEQTVLIPDYRPTVTTTLAVKIAASIDPTTGQLVWTFRTTDPTTYLPPTDPLAGFLPPNDSSGRGEGYVTFEVTLRPDVSFGTLIRNSALIVFDVNSPIETPPVEITVMPPNSVYLPTIIR